MVSWGDWPLPATLQNCESDESDNNSTIIDYDMTDIGSDNQARAGYLR